MLILPRRNIRIARVMIEGFMIATDHLKRIASWSRDLNEREIEIARAGIVEKSFGADEFICMHGDRFEFWTGVVRGWSTGARGDHGHHCWWLGVALQAQPGP